MQLAKERAGATKELRMLEMKSYSGSKHKVRFVGFRRGFGVAWLRQSAAERRRLDAAAALGSKGTRCEMFKT